MYSTEKEPKNPAEHLSEMLETFGNAMSEVFNDPKLKEKAKDFARSATESAKTLSDRFHDEKVRDKFREVGKATQEFGKSIADTFRKPEKE